MNYTIEPIYFVLPVLSMLFSLLGCGNKKPVKFFLVLLFILLYSLSLNGSDYSGYRYLYMATEQGASYGSIHSEIGYFYLMKLFIWAGADYNTLRLFLLTITSIVLFYSVSKLSKNFALSVFFVSTMFIVYTISAYRQYIVIAFSILFIYLYTKGRVRKSIIGLTVLVMFHLTALLPLFCVLFYHIVYRRKNYKHTNYIKNNYTLIIMAALGIRLVITGLLLFGPVKTILTAILKDRAPTNPQLFSFGLVSRLVFLYIVSYMYHKARYVETSTRLLFWYYFVSIVLYIMVPLEFLMGRLMNNANILLAILIPVLRFDFDNIPDRMGRIRINWIRAVVLMLEVFALIILTNQLTQQDGYTPYLNILRGDQPVILEQYDIDTW